MIAHASTVRQAVRAAAALLLGIVLGGDAAAEDRARGTNVAFDAARQSWQEAARAGDAAAHFRLGAAAVLGLGQDRDPRKALEHYRRAAAAGHAAAQFEVGRMLSHGLGAAADPEAAALYFGRAAANGMPRAMRALGDAYANGSGVPQNPSLARAWLARAGSQADALPPSSPAGREKAAPLRPPKLQGGFMLGQRIELVWTSPPVDGAPPFQVEIADIPGGALRLSAETRLSAMSLVLGPDLPPLAWRVYRLSQGGARYAASPWQVLGDARDGGPGLTDQNVRILIQNGDADARRLADDTARALQGRRIQAEIEPVDRTIGTSGVTYGFDTDAGTARDLARILPILAPEDVRRAPEGHPSRPGEIVLHLVGGNASPP